MTQHTVRSLDEQVNHLRNLIVQMGGLAEFELANAVTALSTRDIALAQSRIAADARDVYYSLDLERLRGLYFATGETLHPGLAEAPSAAAGTARRRQRRPRVLFLCTHNSARSQMAEALLRHLGRGEVDAYSAGTVATRVHPLAVAAMAEKGLDISRQRSIPGMRSCM